VVYKWRELSGTITCAFSNIGKYPFEKIAQETLKFYGDKSDLIPLNNNEAVFA